MNGRIQTPILISQIIPIIYARLKAYEGAVLAERDTSILKIMVDHLGVVGLNFSHVYDRFHSVKIIFTQFLLATTFVYSDYIQEINPAFK